MLISANEVMHYTRLLGYTGIALVVFAETGLFFAFFLPGDSLLFTAGLLAAKGVFNISMLLSLIVGVAILGYLLGYFFGFKFGNWLLQKPDSLFYKRRYIDIANDFYQKHGGKAVALARLVPIIRTFAPIVAGMVKMPWTRFVFFTVLGAAFWVCTFGLGGYYLGVRFPILIDWLLPITAVIVLLSVLPAVVSYLKRYLGNKAKV